MPSAIKLEPNQVFISKNYGRAFYMGEAPNKPGSSKRRIYLKFENTGNIQDFELYEASRGNFKDAGASKALDFDPDYIWQTNYGPVKIIEDLGLEGTYRWIKIKFLTTGYEKICLYTSLQNNKVKDPFLPTVYGVGYYGSEKAELNIEQGSIEKIIYHRWINMISRNYNPDDDSYKTYGLLGVTVAPEWQNFTNYLNDIKNKFGYNLFCMYPELYNIDKDYLQSNIPINNRIYSNNTTLIIRIESNAELVQDEPTIYNGVWKKRDGYYAKIYDPNSLFLLNCGPFDSALAAASYLYYKGTLNFVINNFVHFNTFIPIPINEVQNHFITKRLLYSIF